ncbi:L-seryl-tRNA(Sec) selenium transferase [Clostridium thermobutyricum]
MKKDLLRALPKTDKLLENECLIEIINKFGRENVLIEIRNILENYRKNILNDKVKTYISDEIIIKDIFMNLNNKYESTIKKVINGTGVIIHTNLGRSLLSDNAIKNLNKVMYSYNNLEYDIKKGERGSRYSHVEELLKNLTGAEGALVVNNNAAAVLLVLNEFAKEKEVIVSRGELVEIGGSFRVPDVMEMSGAKLKEVGTTNRTHRRDYENSINENTAALLKVHNSNFKIVGFTHEVSSKEIGEIGKENNILTIEDLGSGALIDLNEFGIEEKTVSDVIKSGIDIVTFSGDKLLGGPQAGIIVGKKQYIDRLKKNQLLRALRVDKFTLASLEGTLFSYLDKKKAIEEIPTLNMISMSLEKLEERSIKLKEVIQNSNKDIEVKIVEENDYIGGGTLPIHKLESYAISLSKKNTNAEEIERKLRFYKIPIIGRIQKNEVLIHLRTLKLDDFDIIGEALKEI